MYYIIGKLLILQDRDQRILRIREQLARMAPERETLRSPNRRRPGRRGRPPKRAANRSKSDRKQRELEVEAKKQQIGRYSLQQFQTKKNEEYRALAHEIETCNADIVKLEDAQLELMEQAETTQREILAAGRQAEELKKLADGQIKDLAAREQSLTAELAELESNREQIKSAVDEPRFATLRTPFQNEGRKRGGGHPARRVRRVPHEVSRPTGRHLPGRPRIGHLPQLRTHSLLRQRHGPRPD